MRYLRQTIYTVGVLCRPHAIVGSLTVRHCSGADGVTVSYACMLPAHKAWRESSAGPHVLHTITMKVV